MGNNQSFSNHKTGLLMSISYETRRALARIKNREMDKEWFLRSLKLLEKNGLLKDKNAKCIDFGCSSCEFVEILRDRFGIKSVAADYPPVAVDFAKKMGFESFQFNGNDAESLPSEYVNFADFATCLGTIEHITDLDSFFQLAYRSLQNNGYFVFTTPNSSSYKSYFNYLYEGTVEFEGHHFRFLNKPKLLKLIILNGFDVADELHYRVDSYRLMLAEKIVNYGLNILKPLFLRLVWARCFENDKCYYQDLRILDWGFLVKKDSNFIPIGCFPDMDIKGRIDSRTGDYMLEKIRSSLLNQNIINNKEFELLKNTILQ